jgi:predicted NAD-dependent protein-ADP-ribosyltransferase YbiA (DUF1768 family)
LIEPTPTTTKRKRASGPGARNKRIKESDRASSKPVKRVVLQIRDEDAELARLYQAELKFVSSNDAEYPSYNLDDANMPTLQYYQDQTRCTAPNRFKKSLYRKELLFNSKTTALGFLSNFHLTKFVIGEYIFGTVEHYYQTEKYRIGMEWYKQQKAASLSFSLPDTCPTMSDEERYVKIGEVIYQLLAPRLRVAPLQMKTIANNPDHLKLLHPDFFTHWDAGLKLAVMRQALAWKFSHESRLNNKTIADNCRFHLGGTKGSYIRETAGGQHEDFFWASEGGYGFNMLGRLLVERREQLVHEEDQLSEGETSSDDGSSSDGSENNNPTPQS